MYNIFFLIILMLGYSFGFLVTSLLLRTFEKYFVPIDLTGENKSETYTIWSIAWPFYWICITIYYCYQPIKIILKISWKVIQMLYE